MYFSTYSDHFSTLTGSSEFSVSVSNNSSVSLKTFCILDFFAIIAICIARSTGNSYIYSAKGKTSSERQAHSKVPNKFYVCHKSESVCLSVFPLCSKCSMALSTQCLKGPWRLEVWENRQQMEFFLFTQFFKECFCK